MDRASSARSTRHNATTQPGQEQNGQEDMPLIDALDNADQTPLPHSTSARKKIPSDALKKIRDQQNIIKLLQRQLKQTSEALQDSEQNKAELNDLLQATLTSPGSFRPLVPTGVQTRPIETPGPHWLQARAQRPEDIAYQERLNEQSEREQHQNVHVFADPQPNQPQMMLDLVKQLAKAMKDTNPLRHHRTLEIFGRRPPLG